MLDNKRSLYVGLAKDGRCQTRERDAAIPEFFSPAGQVPLLPFPAVIPRAPSPTPHHVEPQDPKENTKETKKQTQSSQLVQTLVTRWLCASRCCLAVPGKLENLFCCVRNSLFEPGTRRSDRLKRLSLVSGRTSNRLATQCRESARLADHWPRPACQPRVLYSRVSGLRKGMTSGLALRPRSFDPAEPPKTSLNSWALPVDPQSLNRDHSFSSSFLSFDSFVFNPPHDANLNLTWYAPSPLSSLSLCCLCRYRPNSPPNAPPTASITPPNPSDLVVETPPTELKT